MRQLIIACTALILCLNTVFAANLKQSVCVVYSADEVGDSVYSSLVNAFHKKGYLSAERNIKKVGNSFGSGFMYKSKSGAEYIITNQHVVGDSKFVRLSMNSDGMTVKYNGCKVLYADKRQDLALLQIPVDMPVVSLEGYAGTVSDGMDVYTAGYPGLGTEPVWQFGKGIISNSAVQTDAFEDSITVIQHTAQVDPGNSGGPLLIALPSDSDNVYKVIGVNTWKARRRSDTNFSILISDLELFIENYKSGTYVKKTEFDSVRVAFEADLKNGYENSYNYISEKAVLALSEDAVVTMLDFVDNNINAYLRTSDPMTAMRMLIAKMIVKKMNPVFEKIEESVSGDKAVVTYKVGKDNVSLTWENIDNGWSIVSCNYINDDISQKSATSVSMEKSGLYETDWSSIISLGATFPLNENQFYGGSIDYSYAFLNYGLASVGIDIDGVRVNATPKVNGYLYVGIGGRLPINIKRFVMIPYASLGTGAGPFVDSGFKFIGLVRPGLQLGYMVNKKCFLFVALEYTHKFGSGVKAGEVFNYGTLGLRLGVGF